MLTVSQLAKCMQELIKNTLRVCVQVGSPANCMTLCAKDADQHMADSGGAVLACVLYE